MVFELRLRVVRGLISAGVLGACLLLGCETEPSSADMNVQVSGHAFAFTTSGGQLTGAKVSILELPGRTTTTDANGAWGFSGLKIGAPLTFMLQKEGWTTTQTATLRPTKDLYDVTFQVPDTALFKGLAGLVSLKTDASRCQIASTVTRRGQSLYDGHGTHGEPGATVQITPTDGHQIGPTYFNLVKYNIIFPDAGLQETSHDGGVLFLNVKPGIYTLSATLAGATIRSVELNCRAGMLVNASPPWGLQTLTGGLEPKKPGEKGPFD